MSDDEDETTCPLCVEEMDLSDKNFLPCPCGYRVCMWCWHHIRENLNGLCPACRTPYNADPHAFSAVDRQEIVKKNRERKQKEKQERKVSDKPAARPVIVTVADRRHLHNYRVVQRNLVYVIGLPPALNTEETLRRPEYFGQYGKISKVVVHRTQTPAAASVSAYVTFTFKEDAKASIQALDGFWIEGCILRASFGTTKYCNSFIRGLPCSNPDCVYLHDLGDDDDRFTKEEIQAGHSKLNPTPGRDQTIVTGNGGPSGTGKRPTGDPILPAPVFIQDIGASSGASPTIVRSSNSSSSLNAQTPSALGGLGLGSVAAVVNGSSAQVSSPRPLTAAAIVSGVASLSLSSQPLSSATTAASSSSALDINASPSPSPPPSAAATTSLYGAPHLDPEYGGAGVDRGAGSFLVASISTDSAEGFTADPRLVISKKATKASAATASAKASGSAKASANNNKGKNSDSGGLSLVFPEEREGSRMVERSSVNGDYIVQKEQIPKSSSQKEDKTSAAMLESKKTITERTKVDESSTEDTKVSLKAEEAENRFSSKESQSNISFGASSTVASFSSYGRSDRDSSFATESTSAALSALLLSRPPLSATFNGFGKSAVSPVPLTSLTATVWTNILQVPSPDVLNIDPFGRLLLPISELLDLTVPPVDAVCLGSAWPRPPGYYMLGVGLDGVTHGPPTSLVQRITRQHRQLVWGNASSNPVLGTGSGARTLGSGNGGVGMTSGTPAVGAGPLDSSFSAQQQYRQLSLQSTGIVEGQAVLQVAPPSSLASTALAAPTTAQQTLTPSPAQPIAVLQQIFPGVKMTYGAPGSGSAPAIHSQLPNGSSPK